MGIARLVVVALLSSSIAGAEPTVAETERAMAEAAEEGRATRIRGGIALLVVGGVAIGGGAAMVHYEDPDAWVPLGRWFGYGFIGVGSLNLVAGSLLLALGESEHERDHRSLRASIASGEGDAAAYAARVRIANEARERRRTRRSLQWVGGGFAVVGIGAIASGLAWQTEAEGFLIGGGAIAAIGGGLVLGAASFAGPYEVMDASLRRPAVTLAPVRDGAMLSLGGAF